MSENLKTCKELLCNLDMLQRSGENAEDSLYEQLHDLYHRLSGDEQMKVGQYSLDLYKSWTPEEVYEDACRQIENIKSSGLINSTLIKQWEAVKESILNKIK